MQQEVNVVGLGLCSPTIASVSETVSVHKLTYPKIVRALDQRSITVCSGTVEIS